GWTTALLAHIVGPEGIVTGIEAIPDLVTLGQQNLRKYNFPHATILPASPRLDLPAAAPFNRILVSATTEKLPQELVDQLTSDGILVIPVGTDLLRVRKQADGAIHTELLPGFLFVPLVK
ncbi:MAG: protein-L-isoaspartate carboxylmethyltransferase, partial [bacterium]|nr:protein-L-isoaspartate carboxylmethyltransferase [bacterium]